MPPFQLRICFFLVLSISLICEGYAQDCNQNIEIASTQYSEGLFLDAIETVETCKGDSDPKIRLSANRILALCFLALGEQQKAREATKEILRVNPTYKASKLTDSKEFEKLIQSILVIPRFSIGASFSAGTVLSFPEMVTAYRVVDPEFPVTYNSGSGYLLGTSLGFQVNRNISVNLDLAVQQKNYSIDYDAAGLDLRMEEENLYLNAPLTVKYHFDLKGRFDPFIQAGGYGGRILQSVSSYQYENRSGEEGPFSLNNLNSIDRRNKWDYGVTGGIGCMYRLDIGYFAMGLHYQHSFSNITNGDKRNSNPTLERQYYHVDDDLKLHTLMLTFSYHMTLNYSVLDQ